VAALGQPVGQQADVPLDSSEAGHVRLLADHCDSHRAALRISAARAYASATAL